VVDNIIRQNGYMSGSDMIRILRAMGYGSYIIDMTHNDMVGWIISHCYSYHIDKKLVPELQKMCYEAKISTSGNRSNLIGRYCWYQYKDCVSHYINPMRYRELSTQESINMAKISFNNVLTRLGSELKVETKLMYPEGLSEGQVISADGQIYILKEMKKYRFTAYGYAKAGCPKFIKVLSSEAVKIKDGGTL
jgi:hypothetical protein